VWVVFSVCVLFVLCFVVLCGEWRGRGRRQRRQSGAAEEVLAPVSKNSLIAISSSLIANSSLLLAACANSKQQDKNINIVFIEIMI
jgi:uncharacterized membrane protein